jgi:hypothetical protein
VLQGAAAEICLLGWQVPALFFALLDEHRSRQQAGAKQKGKNMKTKSRMKLVLTALAAASILCVPAAIACPKQGNVTGSNALRMYAPAMDLARLVKQGQSLAPDNTAGDSGTGIVGMWEVTLLAGGSVYEHAFQQFTSDGLEVQNSGLIPPLFGNVCYGVWKQQNATSIVLKHYGWTFDAGGNFAGTFVMTATLKLPSPASSNYTGTFVADIVLPSGQADPAQHAEGTISASRITVN